MDGHNNTSIPAPPEASTPDLPRRAPPRLNPDDFAEEMKEFDLSEDQAREFLQTVWDILIMCSDLEMGFDPVSLICGQNPQSGDPAPSSRPDMIESQSDTQTGNNEKEAL